VRLRHLRSLGVADGKKCPSDRQRKICLQVDLFFIPENLAKGLRLVHRRIFWRGLQQNLQVIDVE
jgi:hypothetical protein